jgi:hypothetical protein
VFGPVHRLAERPSKRSTSATVPSTPSEFVASLRDRPGSSHDCTALPALLRRARYIFFRYLEVMQDVPSPNVEPQGARLIVDLGDLATVLIFPLGHCWR